MSTSSSGASVPQTIQPPALDWLTAEEAAEYLKVATRTVNLWAKQGKLRGYALSGTVRHVWRFLQADLDAKLLMPSVPLPQGRVQ